MELFDSVEHQYHRCGVDNLYISAKFCKDAYNHPKKIMMFGVARKSGRGLPSYVIQEELQNEKEKLKVRGTVKAAELIGDPDCPSLLAVSVYDTKPVHFLSSCAESIKWIEKKRKVFDKSTKRMKQMTFLRLNINDDYNYGMGGVDIADELRGSYRFDKWMRNYKWWHSIFWWGFQVLMINSYKCYFTYCTDNNIKPMSHYEFQKKIGHVWLDKFYYENKNSSQISRCSSQGSLSSLSLSTCSTDTSRRQRISELSLNPFSGSCKCRLDRTISHWPSAPKRLHGAKKSNCQLHYWATGKRKYAATAYCQNCNVSLCINGCYEMFHCDWGLHKKKTSLRMIFEKENQE